MNSYYRTSRLEFSYMYPTVQSWNDDDREVVCFLFDVNLEKLAYDAGQRRVNDASLSPCEVSSRADSKSSPNHAR